MENIAKINELNAALKNKLLNLMPEEGLIESNIYGMTVARRHVPNKISRCIYGPIVVLMVQGRKHSIVGSQKLSYGENQYLITGLDLPASSYLVDVSPEKPMLAVSIPVDNYIISDLIATTPKNIDKALTPPSLSVANADSYVLDAFLRLLDILENPAQKDIMAPMIVREIHYRLLQGPLGNHLRAINTFGTKTSAIADAINWLRANYKSSIVIDELAEQVNMAPSTFRKHFKLVTTMSPLQYQKRLRLHEAQRLMLMESHNATSACYSVGYESPTQFNREYKRMFGEPPHKDIKKIIA